MKTVELSLKELKLSKDRRLNLTAQNQQRLRWATWAGNGSGDKAEARRRSSLIGSGSIFSLFEQSWISCLSCVAEAQLL